MNLSILPLLRGKQKMSIGFLTLVRQPVWEKENSDFRPV